MADDSVGKVLAVQGPHLPFLRRDRLIFIRQAVKIENAPIRRRRRSRPRFINISSTEMST